ncbi:hypothetical protein D3C85_1787820 [compost metagenome]
MSTDGKTYQQLDLIENEIPLNHQEIAIKEFLRPCNTKEKIKFIKVDITNIEKLPGWHPGAGNPAWMFSDEIIIAY